MKVDLISLLKHAIKDLTPQKYTALPADIEKELVTLTNGSDSKKLILLLNQSKLPVQEEFIAEFLNRLQLFNRECRSGLSRPITSAEAGGFGMPSNLESFYRCL